MTLLLRRMLACLATITIASLAPAAPPVHAESVAPAVVTDGSGGAIVVWEDSRGGTRDIYAQRLSAGGARLWTDTGVVVCSASGDQLAPRAISDGAGGAIVVWSDQRSGYHVCAQRLSSSGTALWTTDGILLQAASTAQLEPRIVQDGAGGAIVTWFDWTGAVYDVHAQRLSPAGAPLWAPNGAPVSALANNRFPAWPVPDGAAGAVVVWSELRAGNYHVYAQHLDATGVATWDPAGVALDALVGEQLFFLQAATDGAGGAVAAWRRDNGSGPNVVLQRVDAAGGLPWGVTPRMPAEFAGWQSSPVIVADGAGGVICGWVDVVASLEQVRVQRVDAAGTPLWGDAGVGLSPTSTRQWDVNLLADGTGGTIATWTDHREPSSYAQNGDIYAQRVTADGSIAWAADGVPMCRALGQQLEPAIAATSGGGAIVAWADFREWLPPARLDSALFAQRVGMGGVVQWSSVGARVYYTDNDVVNDVDPPPATGLALAVANPARGSIRVRFTLPDARAARLEVIDVGGRRVATRTLDGFGDGRHAVDVPAARPGLFFVRLVTAAGSRTGRVCVME